MGELIIIQPVTKRFRETSKRKEVIATHVYDVYRILTDKTHALVYRGYADIDAALRASKQLQDKTSSTCYVVGRKVQRMKKVGTRK